LAKNLGFRQRDSYPERASNPTNQPMQELRLDGHGIEEVES